MQLLESPNICRTSREFWPHPWKTSLVHGPTSCSETNIVEPPLAREPCSRVLQVPCLESRPRLRPSARQSDVGWSGWGWERGCADTRAASFRTNYSRHRFNYIYIYIYIYIYVYCYGARLPDSRDTYTTEPNTPSGERYIYIYIYICISLQSAPPPRGDSPRAMERFRAGLPLRATRSDMRAPTGPVRMTHPSVDLGAAASLQGGGASDTGSMPLRATDIGTFQKLHRLTSSRQSHQTLASINTMAGKQKLFTGTVTPSEPPRKTLKSTPSTAATVASESEDSSDPEEVDLHISDAGSSEPPKQTRFPARIQYTRGSASGLDEADADQEVSGRVHDLKWAASGAYSGRARETWWLRRAAQRGIEAYPLTPGSLKLAAGLLRKGGYRSAEMYFSTFKNAHIRLGHQWTEQHALEHTESTRAVRRGLGPPRQADALPFDQIVNVQVPEEDPFEPAHTLAVSRDVAIVASWWMMREIELAAATIGPLSLGRILTIPRMICAGGRFSICLYLSPIIEHWERSGLIIARAPVRRALRLLLSGCGHERSP